MASLEVFKHLEKYGHEELALFTNKDVGLKAIVAIHNTTLGPALGGCRMWTYASDLDAIEDCLRLARGMTYKAAAAGLNLGGGKAVIVGDSKSLKSEGLFRAFGRFVETLNGRYITAEDVGTDVNDMEYVFMETRYVTGVTQAHGGSGDPSPVTAYGVLQGIKACIHETRGEDSLKGVSVAIQGLGNVGYNLLKHLLDEGAKVVATDIDRERCERVAREHKGVEIVAADSIFGVNADVFAPCAMGAIVNDDTLPKMKFKIIAGGANNQLKEDRHGTELRRKGILYAPDYVINAGGLINVYNELEGYDRERALRMTRGIYYNLLRTFAIAKKNDIPTNAAADRMAEERIETVSRSRRAFLGANPGPLRQLEFRRASGTG